MSAARVELLKENEWHRIFYSIQKGSVNYTLSKSGKSIVLNLNRMSGAEVSSIIQIRCTCDSSRAPRRVPQLNE